MDTVLKIPSGASPGEVIELGSNELPDVAAEVLSVLQHVQAPLASWVDVAAEYFRQRKFAQFEAVFRETFAAGEYGTARVRHPRSRGGPAANPNPRPLYLHSGECFGVQMCLRLGITREWNHTLRACACWWQPPRTNSSPVLVRQGASMWRLEQGRTRDNLLPPASRQRSNI